MSQVLKSQIDKSVNFVEQQLVGFLESRYVRKIEDYFICYLSSQTGCNRGCKFCHLTASGQTAFVDSTLQDYLNQAKQVFDHYQTQIPAKYMHYNFMARGEALANQNLITNGDEILLELGKMALANKVKPKFNISTIMPKTLKQSLVDIFPLTQPTIYYSLYSVDPAFRRKWLPASMNPLAALDQLKEYQNLTKKIIKIHFAFIAGENDSLESLQAMCDELNKRNLICEFNLVRYNPFSPEQGAESSEEVLQRNLEFLKDNFKGKVQMIPRVGFDVKASCGMFVK
jgi:adenine C2-methylase RlmN of 23S rRNA A2503 and tRNA A37